MTIVIDGWRSDETALTPAFYLCGTFVEGWAVDIAKAIPKTVRCIKTDKVAIPSALFEVIAHLLMMRGSEENTGPTREPAPG